MSEWISVENSKELHKEVADGVEKLVRNAASNLGLFPTEDMIKDRRAGARNTLAYLFENGWKLVRPAPPKGGE